MRDVFLAGFDDAETAFAAAKRLRAAGYVDLDVYGPYPAHGMSESLGLGPSTMARFAAVGGFGGAAAGYLLQWWINARLDPLIVGGRPPHSPLAFVPITFECGILGAALFLFFGLLWRARLPQPWHPVFEEPAFASASSDGWWISVSIHEDRREEAALRRRFDTLGARHVSVAGAPA